MTRSEHMQWCKDRALAYLPTDPQQAVTSMLSDLSKHEETAAVLADGFMFQMAMATGAFEGADDARRFITGFN